MSIQLTKEEKRIYTQTIVEELDRDEHVSSLKIVWEIHKRITNRHTVAQMHRLLKPRLNQIRKLRRDGTKFVK